MKTEIVAERFLGSDMSDKVRLAEPADGNPNKPPRVIPSDMSNPGRLFGAKEWVNPALPITR
ncbi:hypothetical protein HYU93_00880 [Candidatus Daviesbacteria bacterium]|nr:hypothetical protein [Candidatus Daviesbacteria bacterium]